MSSRVASFSQLPLELLIKIWEYIEDGSFSRRKRALTSLCQRLRYALLPHLYREIAVDTDQSLFTQRLSGLLELLGSYGQHVHDLHISIHAVIEDHEIAIVYARLGIPSSDLHQITCMVDHLPNLRGLTMRFLRPDPFWVVLTAEELNSVSSMFKRLSGYDQLEEIHLRGFAWKDFEQSFGACQLSNLRKLRLSASSPSPPSLRSASFTQNLPNLSYIQIPAAWCPGVDWFRWAFGRFRLSHIRIGERDNGHDEDDCHPHQVAGCSWSNGLAIMFTASASSLTHLTISSPSFPSSQLVRFMSCVTSIVVKDISFLDSRGLNSDALLEPFATLPILTSLRILCCENISPGFSEFFNPSRNESRRARGFCALTELELSYPDTFRDLDPTDIPSLYGFSPLVYWGEENRRTLEANCERLGIESTIHWNWIET